MTIRPSAEAETRNYVTIDNLGLDASQTYAKAQEALDARFVRDSQVVGRKAEVSVITPYRAVQDKETALLSSRGAPILWANIDPPISRGKSAQLFTTSLIPSLGGQDRLQDTIDQFVEKGTMLPEGLQHDHQTIKHMLDQLISFERLYTLIDGMRRRYQGI